MQAYMQEHGLSERFVCPALPHQPQQAVRAIESELARHDPSRVTFVGSSLGGFYATWFTERRATRAVLINPAIRPHIGLERELGGQQNLYSGERYTLTRAHLEGWRALQVPQVDPERYLLLLETGDELLDWREAARKYEGARSIIRSGGDHTMKSFPEHLPCILAFAGMERA